MQTPGSPAVDRLRRGDKAAIPAVVAALAENNEDLRSRAALALYDLPEPEELAKHKEAGANLRKAVRDGHRSAAALLLLGYFPGEETERLLNDVASERPPQNTKLKNWGPVVPASLPARVAASLLGVPAARRYLLDQVESMPAEQRQFLLEAIREIDAPELLHRLAISLGDKTIISGGAPAGVEGQRRLCDLAATALVRHLALPVDFKVDDGVRYTDAQIETVRTAMRKTVPQ